MKSAFAAEGDITPTATATAAVNNNLRNIWASSKGGRNLETALGEITRGVRIGTNERPGLAYPILAPLRGRYSPSRGLSHNGTGIGDPGSLVPATLRGTESWAHRGAHPDSVR